LFWYHIARFTVHRVSYKATRYLIADNFGKWWKVLAIFSRSEFAKIV